MSLASIVLNFGEPEVPATRHSMAVRNAFKFSVGPSEAQ